MPGGQLRIPVSFLSKGHPKNPRQRHRSRSPAARRVADEDQAPVEPRAKQARQSVYETLPHHELSLSPCDYWKAEDAAVAIEVDLPQWCSPKRKEMMRDFSAFIVRQMKRQNVEVSERRLSELDKNKFREAKLK